MAVEENRIHFRKLVQTLQWTFLMLLSVQHNLSKTQTVLFTLVSGVTCLYVGLLGLRLRAGVVWRGRGRGSSCPALTLLATVCTGHVGHAGHVSPHLVSGIWSSAAMSAVSCPESHPRTCGSGAQYSTKYHHLMMALELESYLSKVLRFHNHRAFLTSLLRALVSRRFQQREENFAKIRF